MTAKLFSDLAGFLSQALAPHLKAAESLDALMTEDVLFEFPYAPEGFTRRIEGLANLQTYLAAIGQAIVIDRMTGGMSLVTPDQAMIEIHMQGHRAQDGQAYNQTYVAALKLREGRISHYRDYWNPLPVLDAAKAGALG